MKLCSIIINLNGIDHIKRCIDAALAQTYNNIEIIIIDNASVDGLKELIANNYPKLIVTKNNENIGFSAALNQGIRISRGNYILSLRSDVFLEKDFLEKIIPEMEKDKNIGTAACKLLNSRTDNFSLIYSAGHIASVERTFSNRGNMKIDKGQYDKKEFVFGACAAAAVYKKEMLEDIKIGDEYFDESYFACFEDVDVGWRAQIRGWKCIYVPNAIAIYESKCNGINTARNLKNRLSTIFKNDYGRTFLTDFPFIFIFEINNLFYKYLTNREHRKALIDFIHDIPILKVKRKMIQKRRVSSPEYMLSMFKMDEASKNTFVSFFLSLFFTITLVYFLGLFKIIAIILFGYITFGEGSHLILNWYSAIHKGE